MRRGRIDEGVVLTVEAAGLDLGAFLLLVYDLEVLSYQVYLGFSNYRRISLVTIPVDRLDISTG